MPACVQHVLKHDQACAGSTCRHCQHCVTAEVKYEYNKIEYCLTVIFHVQQRSEKELKKVVTPEDAPVALRVVLHDAATYDVATGKGGLNGSIVNRYMRSPCPDKHRLCHASNKIPCKFCIDRDGAHGCVMHWHVVTPGREETGMTVPLYLLK